MFKELKLFQTRSTDVYSIRSSLTLNFYDKMKALVCLNWAMLANFHYSHLLSFRGNKLYKLHSTNTTLVATLMLSRIYWDEKIKLCVFIVEIRKGLVKSVYWKNCWGMHSKSWTWPLIRFPPFDLANAGYKNTVLIVLGYK